MKIVFQVGPETTNAVGDQQIKVSVNGVTRKFTFSAGNHVHVGTFVERLRQGVSDIEPISQLKNIMVEHEMRSWLSFAMQDRLGRDLAASEALVVQALAETLQQRYETEVKKILKRALLS